AGSTDRDQITSWRRNFKFTPGKRAGADWNFETPNNVPRSQVPSTVKLPRNGNYEFYEFPARALDMKAAEHVSGRKVVGGGTERTPLEVPLPPGASLTSCPSRSRPSGGKSRQGLPRPETPSDWCHGTVLRV
ncbi:MAG: hypothetical protein FWD61_20755, partial [Phycisphaerales bacterium]|nr:hypothetical protein [Phycisphaerales bacterium]